VPNNCTNNSHKQTKKSARRVNVKSMAYRLGVKERALRYWLRVQYGRRRKPWLWTGRRAEQVIAAYQEDRR
jgi:hypothetical protein